jgi:hypothetical protein
VPSALNSIAVARSGLTCMLRMINVLLFLFGSLWQHLEGGLGKRLLFVGCKTRAALVLPTQT